MHQRLKERLVGAAVLVVIAVIFIPMLLTGPIDSNSITKTNIPERPSEKFNARLVPLKPIVEDENMMTTDKSESHVAIDIEKEEPNKIKDDKIVESKVVNKKDITDKKPARVKIVSDAQIGLTAWVVQLGSFTDKVNADKLNLSLRKAGFPAFVDPLSKDGKTSYRVRVGPEILQADAHALLKKIKSKVQLDGIVLSYP